MTVLHQSAAATVVHGDAREVLAGLEREHADLVVVDPPYGVEWQSSLRAERFDVLHEDGAGDRDGVRQILVECVRATGQNRHLYVFGPDDVLDGLLVTKPVALVWDKMRNGAGDTSAPWAPAHEPVWFMVGKGRHAGQAGRDTSVPARLRKGSVLSFMPQTGRKVRHPSEKPLGLLRELIESSSRQGELVLDPCAGSGSTGVAAVLLGRRSLLIESHEPYARLAADRVREAEKVAAMMGAL
jgi:DNA modification methylase